MEQTLANFNTTLNGWMTPLDNTTIKGFLMVFLILYGTLLAPTLPKAFLSIFDNVLVKAVAIFLIIWTSNHDPAIAIAVAVVFMVLLNLTVSKPTTESFEGPRNAIYPGCMNLTVYDLLDSFKNDVHALTRAMRDSRVPEDIAVTDYYAPLIGTYLLNYGHVLKAPCTPPTSNPVTTWV
ncbi:hypothetical protein BDK51DRAFT_50043 [Blyttiomyces helicus]|uniref:Uncharacterized protein n=1 Tax=Blyttiomyces helicus TaxID=388810 RepID=A0A4P9WQ65_9FUNG|nr:hypothetical protein BDK51DRAFT_50043 [Blyttiomyces helicus]|eukprot:RKO94515.1 hypothetical protein BDK51DRAFT_50043 [Blyttiomyces helicus]